MVASRAAMSRAGRVLATARAESGTEQPAADFMQDRQAGAGCPTGGSRLSVVLPMATGPVPRRTSLLPGSGPAPTDRGFKLQSVARTEAVTASTSPRDVAMSRTVMMYMKPMVVGFRGIHRAQTQVSAEETQRSADSLLNLAGDLNEKLTVFRVPG